MNQIGKADIPLQPIQSFSWEEIEGLTRTLTDRIVVDGVPDILVGVQRGGLIPLVLLSHRLAVTHVLTLSARRTLSDGVYAAKQAAHLVLPEYLQAIAGKDVILVDDIVGSGATVQAVRAALAAYRPRRLREAIYLVNLAHWEPAQRQPPTQEMTYIGQMIRAWAVFPWESHEETDAVLEGEPLQPAWKRSTQP